MPRLRTVTSSPELDRAAHARRADRSGAADVEDARHPCEPTPGRGHVAAEGALSLTANIFPDVGGGPSVAVMSNDDLSAGSVGTVIRPGDSEWESARRFHSGIGEPAAVIRAASVDDVRGAVRYAAAERLDVMVRGGGHSAWGGVPGGLTLDLSALDAVEVDGTRVRVGGGAIWGGVAHALAERGLGLSSGDTASVGVGGLTLGGGIGWMVRAWGLAADQLVGAQLVTARGDVVEVTETSHPELLWALRGGGGNFGVVTRFDFEAHPLDGVVRAVYGLDGRCAPGPARAARRPGGRAARAHRHLHGRPGDGPERAGGRLDHGVLDRRRRGRRASRRWRRSRALDGRHRDGSSACRTIPTS